MPHKIETEDAKRLINSLLERNRNTYGLYDCELVFDFDYNLDTQAIARYLGPNKYEILFRTELLSDMRGHARRLLRGMFNGILRKSAPNPTADQLRNFDQWTESKVEPLVEAALYLCFYHELGHVVCNHFDYFFGDLEVSELAASGGHPRLDFITHHALEYQADAFWAQQLFTAISDKHDWLFPAPDRRPSVFFTFGLAMSLLIELLHPEQRTIAQHIKLGHPHPAVRWILATNAMSLRIGGGGNHDFIDDWIQAAEIAKDVFGELHKSAANGGCHWSQENTDDILAQVQLVFNRRAELREMFDVKYADIVALNSPHSIYV